MRTGEELGPSRHSPRCFPSVILYSGWEIFWLTTTPDRIDPPAPRLSARKNRILFLTNCRRSTNCRRPLKARRRSDVADAAVADDARAAIDRPSNRLRRIPRPSKRVPRLRPRPSVSRKSGESLQAGNRSRRRRAARPNVPQELRANDRRGPPTTKARRRPDVVKNDDARNRVKTASRTAKRNRVTISTDSRSIIRIKRLAAASRRSASVR